MAAALSQSVRHRTYMSDGVPFHEITYRRTYNFTRRFPKHFLQVRHGTTRREDCRYAQKQRSLCNSIFRRGTGEGVVSKGTTTVQRFAKL